MSPKKAFVRKSETRPTKPAEPKPTRRRRTSALDAAAAEDDSTSFDGVLRRVLELAETAAVERSRLPNAAVTDGDAPSTAPADAHRGTALTTLRRLLEG